MAEEGFWSSPYRVARQGTLARNVVATSQPLAAQAGIETLRAGGNAVDAALATAIALVVVEPVSNGLGSDAFAIVWDGRTLHALNASGRSPQAWTTNVTGAWRSVPQKGWHSVTVPGAVSAWSDLSTRFGKLPFERLFDPAIRYAEEGFPVSLSVARRWASQADSLRREPGFAQAFLPDDRAPRPGEIFRFPDLARSLRILAKTHGRDLYEGELAGRIVAFAKQCGAHLAAPDLAGHRNEWCGTISGRVLGYDVHEMLPNGPGVVVLSALGILSHFEPQSLDLDSADAVHLQIEAMKLAFADSARHLSDPATMTVKPDALLDPAYLKNRAGLIRKSQAQQFETGIQPGGGTVYLTAADASGMLVSFIQSNFMGFGSGVVVPGTGISFHNRASGFTLEPNHPNSIGPGKRPAHSIVPALVTRDAAPVMSLGVSGGNMQPQGHVQVALRVLAAGQNPQTAIDALRFRFVQGLEINLEAAGGSKVAEELTARGHRIVGTGHIDFGSAQIAYRLPDGWLAATDARKDGAAAGW